MTRAFRPSSPKLLHPQAKVKAEREGIYHLMRGAIQWFKNPPSHRPVEHEDPTKAAHALAFANLLLDMVDECKQVT